MMKELPCSRCGNAALFTDDQGHEDALCEKCQGEWNEAQAILWIMEGGMDDVPVED